MTCSSSERLFEAYLDDTLLPATRARLLAHLRSCGPCKGVLDELRVVDALLVSPRVVALPENFTFATVAEVGSLPRPRTSRAPVVAYLLSYLAAAWLLIAAAFVLAPSVARTVAEIALDAARELTHVAGTAGHAAFRLAGDFGSLGSVIGIAAVVDALAALALVAALTASRRRLAERARS